MRKTHHHQTFAPDGTLLSEIIEEEPLVDYHERELKERLNTLLSAGQAKLQEIDQFRAQIATARQGIAADRAQIPSLTTVQHFQAALNKILDYVDALAVGLDKNAEHTRDAIRGVIYNTQLDLSDLDEIKA